MSSNVYDVLKERGFIYQSTDEENLRKILNNEKITCYIGFDPTADSLHVGSLVPIMSLVHMQRAGHKVLVVVGGGTAKVGDPSGKTEMRKMLTPEQIVKNAEGLKKQLSQYISFESEKAIMLDNSKWLDNLNYIEFLRDIGRHFSVNRMLTAESYKIRLEKGLSFLEFNYMILQAYDFYVLAKDYNCILQMGGQDQWGNIVAGIDLIRRKLQKEAYGLTFPLITNASGEKFGKTVAGAIWLDENKTSAFDFYQFWRNVEDADVMRFLGLFTLLPMDEVKYLGSLNPPLINRAKEILAYEVTKLAHSKEKAKSAYISAVKQFGKSDLDGIVKTSSDIVEISEIKEDLTPTITLEEGDLGKTISDILVSNKVLSSKGEVKRLISQNGISLDGKKVKDFKMKIEKSFFENSEITLKIGKKRIYKIKLI